MSNTSKISAECLTPILYVRDFAEAMNYYTKKLLFDRLWDWGEPLSFGAVRLDRVEIFFCLGAQGHPGTWLSIFVDDVDDYFERITKLGAEVIYGPVDEPWGVREMHVRDPNQHVIRFGHGIPLREPKMEIERVAVETRIEKRLAKVMRDLARHKSMTVGEMLEETLLHTFEKLPNGGVASPHTQTTFAHIQELKKEHGIDYDCHASYRFVERAVPSERRRVGKRKRPRQNSYNSSVNFRLRSPLGRSARKSCRADQEFESAAFSPGRWNSLLCQCAFSVIYAIFVPNQLPFMVQPSPTGLKSPLLAPGVETPGYYPVSLRDRTGFEQSTQNLIGKNCVPVFMPGIYAAARQSRV